MSNIDSEKSIARSASHFLTGTMISRITGMIRDLSMAFCFGTSPAVAAFLLSFRLSNLLRRLFGEGALLNGFIPFFESKRRENPVNGAKFFRDLFWSLAIILFFSIIGLEIILYSTLSFFELSEGNSHIIHMMMVMVPGIIFICLFGLSMALLECEKNFFTPGVAPVAFNFVWIAAIWYSRHRDPYEAMMVISISIVLAFFIQWWVTLPGTIRYIREFLSWKEVFQPTIFSRSLRDMIVPLLLGVAGVASVQINSSLDVIIARLASLEGPAYLSYAHRLQQLPLALFGIAISSALMPALTRAIKNNDSAQYTSLLSFGLARTFSLLLPGTVAIFVLGGASVNMLYGRGVFNNLSTLNTTLCLWGYGVGLLPAAFVLLLAPAFYARRDFWTPTLASIISVTANLVLNLLMVFVFKFGALSIALATSVTAIINMVFLFRRLHVKIFGMLVHLFAKVTFVSLLAGMGALLVGAFFLNDPTIQMYVGNFEVVFVRGVFKQLNHFFLLFGTFSILFLSLSYLFKVDHILELFFLKKTAP